MVWVHFQIWKVWLCKIKNSNKIGKKKRMVGDNVWVHFQIGNYCIYILIMIIMSEKHENWSILVGAIFIVQGRCPNREI
jgi:hypothetical protein